MPQNSPSTGEEGRVVGPGFHKQVHDLMRKVPPGKVTTYGDIAGALGSRQVARHVGYAMAALPEGSDVPWWRVVAAGGRLSTGASATLQAKLLRSEGLAVTKGEIREFDQYR